MLITEVIIPPDRQRSSAVADETLLSSIDKYGLINAIVVKTDGTLVSGERRLDAHKQLKKEFIEVKIFEELSNLDAFQIELQENIARKQLTWQEECRAVHKFHLLKVEAAQPPAPPWTHQGTATELGFSHSWVSKLIIIAEELETEGPAGDIANAATQNGAFNLITKRAERAKAAAQARGLLALDNIDERLGDPNASASAKTDALMAKLTKPIQEITAAPGAGSGPASIIEQGREAVRLLKNSAPNAATPSDDRIICTDFVSWAAKYSGPKFDVIHCDFPYGKNHSGSRTRQTGKATTLPTYQDTSDILWTLLSAFLTHQDNFINEKAHLIFWFDMGNYSSIISAFGDAGWKLTQPFPLIWTKAYRGTAADTSRRPRHCYETALLFSRGDRKLIKLDNDHIAAQIEEKLHMSQKPEKALKHFLGMLINEYTAVLDPTCGSGSALSAALSLGAERVLGIEIDRSNADVATTIINRRANTQLRLDLQAAAASPAAPTSSH